VERPVYFNYEGRLRGGGDIVGYPETSAWQASPPALTP